MDQDTLCVAEIAQSLVEMVRLDLYGESGPAFVGDARFELERWGR